jgi:hypothetical protein
MTKIVINAGYGGFSLSEEAYKFLGLPWDGYGFGYGYIGDEEDENTYVDENYYEVKRDDPKLLECVEMLGERANGAYGKLKIVEIPDDVEWEIHSCDSGWEWIAEKHRTWD